jgi:ABC-type Zn uptake system ZnuABC Zn-binding protein ZnuA
MNLRPLLFVAWLFVMGSTGVSAAEGKKLKVLTSFLPTYCFTANVVGDLATVENLLPAAVGPHEFQFSPSDLRRLTQADMFIANGLQLESWLDKAVAVVGKNKLKVVEVAAGLDQQLIHEEEEDHDHHAHAHDHGHDHAGPNPHIWLDPKLAAHSVSNILAALQKADPANAAGYAANAAAYLKKLAQLDQDIQQGLSDLKSRNIVTYHNAFPYFVRSYKLKLVGVMEQTPDVTPSPKHINQLLKLVRENDVKVIFTEPQFSPRLAEQLAKDVKIAVAQLDTLETGELKPDAYEQGMRRNLATLQKYLR